MQFVGVEKAQQCRDSGTMCNGSQEENKAMIYVAGLGGFAFGFFLAVLLASAARADCEREAAFWRERARQLEQQTTMLREERSARRARSEAMREKLQQRLDRSKPEKPGEAE